MADADTTIYLVEQGRTQVGELAGGDGWFRTQTIVVEELSQIQTLEGERDGTVWGEENTGCIATEIMKQTLQYSKLNVTFENQILNLLPWQYDVFC